MVAVARNGIIGRDGGLPWRMSSDLKLFRKLTLGKPIVMGRRTYASLGKPLDGRDNLVVTRDRNFQAVGCEIFSSLDDALARAHVLAVARGVDEVMIIGGADIYRQVLPKADRMYWTRVEADVEGDTSFPQFEMSAWHTRSAEPIPQGPKDAFPATLLILERVVSSKP